MPFSFGSHILTLKHPLMTTAPSQMDSIILFLKTSLLTCEARGAEAKEGSWEIKAAGSTGTWATQTLVHLCLTLWPFKAYGIGGESGTAETSAPSHSLLPRLSSSLPGRHLQWKAPGWSWHCPPLAQGELLHSSMSSSHQVPVNPGGEGSRWGEKAKVIEEDTT